MRSPTAADLVCGWPGFTADFAGLSKDADEKLGVEQVEAADLICVMEARQARRLKALYPRALRGKPVHVLNIPDRFAYGAPALIALLTARLAPILRAGRG